MTDRNETLIQFPLSGRREIVAEFNREMITLDTVRMLIAYSSAAQPQIQPAEFEKWQECRAEFKQGNSPGVATFHHEQQAGPSLDRSALPAWLRASTSVWRAEGDSGIHWKVIRERNSTGCRSKTSKKLVVRGRIIRFTVQCPLIGVCSLIGAGCLQMFLRVTCLTFLVV